MPPSSELRYSVILVGDAGETADNPDRSVLPLLQSLAGEAGEESTILFLGDNIYPSGLPAPDDPGRAVAEQRLIGQLEAVKDHTGRVLFIPGNHDWNNSRPGGLEAVKRQEEFVEAYLGRGNVFLPGDGFPGPVDLELVDDDDTGFDKDIRLILLDTEWWLTEAKKGYGDTGEYDLEDAGDFLVELRQILRDRQNDHVIVAGHHPLYSNGSRGGHFPFLTHLAPPVFGTLYVLYRKFFGFRQDISSFRYRQMKRELTSEFASNESLVYVSGHQHNLQYFNKTGKRMDHHYIVSGSASKVDFAAKGQGADFAYQGVGLMVIRYYNDGSVWLEAWSPGENNASGQGERLFSRRLVLPGEDPFRTIDPDSAAGPLPDFSDSTVTVPANAEYDEPDRLFRAILGSHNREFWSIPVEVPVFDIATVEGGLEAVKLGGKGQSFTLRLRNSEGREFVLRSTDKVAGKTWDPQLKNTLAHDLAQDQFSIINPYGAYVIPPLAESAGIYHTKPRLYYIPDDPRLGEFGRQMAGKLALFEERPDDDMSHAPHMGNSEEVISTRAMLTEVENDLDHRVDQRMLARNRLFDMWLSDWDRHEDQWRWASFEPFELDSTLRGDYRTEGKIYRPIPRDRDVAFMVMNGIIPILSKYTFNKYYQDFRPSYGNLKGLSGNSLALTRRFTNEVTRVEWLSIAEEMQSALSDRVIEEAVKQGLPEPVFEARGEWMIGIMKIRRDKLREVADEYFELLNRIVDVVGSAKDEYVEISVLDRERVEVNVFKHDDREKPYFRRVFLAGETDEIRVYGLGGEDEFELRGELESPITVRIAGGSGRDRYAVRSQSSLGAAVILYDDSAEGNEWIGVEELKIRYSGTAMNSVYEYKRGFRYNTADPLLYFGHNRDDGLFVGGGIALMLHGYGKQPYAAAHSIRANIAAATGAFNFRYSGRFTGLAGPWDGGLEVSAQTPNTIRNFLGLGNETRETVDDDEFYRARLLQYRIAPALERRLPTGLTFSFGPFFQLTEVREDAGRFISQPQAGVSPDTFEDQWYTGMQMEAGLSSLDNAVNPLQGFRWSGRADYSLGVKNTSYNHATLAAALSMYISPSLSPQLTLATRVGVEHIIGEFPFYKASSLGGTRNLRGLRSTRYNGRTGFYNNIELRGKLFEFSNYLLGGEAGFLGFLDHGRVWADDENSNAWHFGYGGGAWVSLFDITVIRGSIGFSEGEWNLLLGAGFFF